MRYIYIYMCMYVYMYELLSSYVRLYQKQSLPAKLNVCLQPLSSRLS